jgi:hypothetical protein
VAIDRVHAVHTTRRDEVGAVEIVFEDERQARDYARSRSTDYRVLAVSVISYVLGQLGTRHPVAWYRNGQEQPPRAARPGTYYPTDGLTEDPASNRFRS